jgi:hypothetical protein
VRLVFLSYGRWGEQLGEHRYISPRHDAEVIILDSNAQDQALGLQFLQAILTMPAV